MSLTEKVTIVTGGGGAIGKAICRHLVGAGANVAVFDLAAEAAERTVAALREGGGEGAAFAVDVCCYDSVAEAVDQVLRRFGRIDILVNCAGGSARDKMALFHEQSLDVIHAMLNVNLIGALHCIRAVSPILVEAKRGSIINVTSIVARGGMKRCVEYGAAKGGLIAATRSLALELGPHNITVNCVSPGLVQREPVEDETAFAHRFSAVNRLCTQDDVARVVLFLAQPESDFITGQELAVDGGRSLGLKGSR